MLEILYDEQRGYCGIAQMGLEMAKEALNGPNTLPGGVSATVMVSHGAGMPSEWMRWCCTIKSPSDCN